jgi:choline dehydrogenase-like flavoprotein
MSNPSWPAATRSLFLKVRGVERLRVADASVLPTVPNGNVHATVVAVAHRAAEIIVAEAAGRSV